MRLPPRLDKTRRTRHKLTLLVIRALRLLALLTAFFVVALRGLGGLPAALTCSPVSVEADSQLCPAVPQPVEADSLSLAAVDDDSDDSADALLAPAALELNLLPCGVARGLGCGALVAQRALPSHAPSLERPPRS